MAVPLARRGASFAPDLAPGDPALREVGRQFAPVVLGLSLVQINEFLNTLIAKLFVPGDGAVSALYYGNQLTQLPLSIVGTAIATALFPLMAAAAAGGRPREFSDLLEKGMRGALFLAIPASAGLILFAGPIIQLIFEHGRFGPDSTARAARVMSFYSLSLAFYCANQIQVRAFYAAGDTKTPVRVSSSMVFLTLALSVVLVRPMGEAGISLATSIGGLGSFVALQILLRRRMDARGGPVARTFVLAMLASAVMGAAAWGVRALLPATFGLPATLDRAARLGLSIGAGVLVYFAAALAMGMPEARQVLRLRRS
jgi:putative peptidoglycan lipid II flippase